GPRADRWRAMQAVGAAVLAVSLFQFGSAPASLAQTETPAKPAAKPIKKPIHHAKVVKPANDKSPTDTQADQLNEKWLSDFNKAAAEKAAAEKTAAESPTPEKAAAIVTPPAPIATPTAAAPASPVGTEEETHLSAPSVATLPGAGTRALMPGSIIAVKADTTAQASAFMPGGAGQPIFKDLNEAFAGFAPNGGAKIEMLKGRTVDGATRLLFVSFGDARKKQSYWWFSPPDQPEGWFDMDGRRLGGTVLSPPKPDAAISSPFGRRRYYGRTTGYAFHNGIDFEAHMGDPIYAAADGVVNHANWYYNYGRTVKITHADNFETLYAHMSRIAPGIVPGVTIHRGDVIGYVGSTGRSTGPHLHFSTIVDGQFVDPAPYLAGNGGESVLSSNALVSFRQWQQDLRQAAGSQKVSYQQPSGLHGGAEWSQSPFAGRPPDHRF
ncbi:MAG TPA: M23 family metallopeptidase, partial [Reyranella sp.]|nr:M23 family metallopeptidase [Reyranella sp.]